MQALQRLRQGRHGTRQWLPHGPHQETQGVAAHLATTGSHQGTTKGNPGHRRGGQHKLQAPPGMARSNVLPPGKRTKTTISRAPRQQVSRHAGKAAADWLRRKAAIHQPGCGALQGIKDVGRGVTSKLGVIEKAGDAIGSASKATAKDGAAAEGGDALVATLNALKQACPVSGRAAMRGVRDAQGRGHR